MLIPLHGIASRRDLPLPFSFVVVGAVLALVISFAILIFAWRKPRFHYVGGHPLPGLTAVLDHPIVQIIARLLVLATYATGTAAMGARLVGDLGAGCDRVRPKLDRRSRSVRGLCQHPGRDVDLPARR
jgi:hypothetical protein